MLNFLKANKWNFVIIAFAFVIALNIVGYITKPAPVYISNRGRNFVELSVETTNTQSALKEDEKEIKFHLQDIKTGERFWTYDLNGDGALYSESPTKN